MSEKPSNSALSILSELQEVRIRSKIIKWFLIVS
jgi:hypothetical protein